ncbi:hypothetical protein [Bradyrhizobium sp. Gha]|uniref:hypothetical protein n=1 Tax=Bradyrhizobium sp. Gha TaxID=1855318 RepID=UPI0015A72387|nr:hypothetical protein [Bradyrhizobium sp. Gha]
MIKIVMLGLCVGGVGAIAAATFKSAPMPMPPVTYPVVAGNKADRLSLVSVQDIQPTVEKGDLTLASPPEPPIPAQSQLKKSAKAEAPEFIPRHWHDPNDTASAIKPKPERSRSASHKDLSTTKVAETQDCRTDGIGSLMRKLSLQPNCSR